MADVLITPASGIIEFKDGSNNVDGQIELLGTGNLQFTSPGGRLLFDDSQFTSSLYDTSGATGTAGQILSSTGTGVDWIDASSISGGDANTLDGLDSTQFLRSDVADTAAGLITFTAIPAFNGGTSGSTAPFTVDSNTVVTNLNADLLDGLDSSQFLRSDANDTTTGQIIFTKANNTATGGGQIYLNGATGNRIDYNQNGVAAPAFTTRSVGAKLVLYPSIAATSADYALGIEGATLWSGVPTTSQQFKWYGGTSTAATLTGAGNFTATGTVQGTRLISTQTTGTAPLTVSSTTVVSNLNADLLDGIDSVSFLRSDANDNATGIITFENYTQFGPNPSDTGSTTPGAVSGNAAYFVSRGGIDQTAARSNTIHLMRDGTSGVIYAGAASFDIDRWETNGVNARTRLYLSLAHTSSLSGMIDVMSWRSDGRTTALGALELDSTLLDINNSAGTAGQILSSTGTGVDWIDASGITAGDADTLDGLDSTQFLRSDVADTAAGLITFNAGLTIGASQVITHNANSTRDKIRVWNSSSYTIGMNNPMTFGGLSSYAMTFQMNNDSTRGFWWGDSVHTDAQGAMSLTTDGKLNVAHSIRLGYGEADTTTPGATYRLDVSGRVLFSNGSTSDSTAELTIGGIGFIDFHNSLSAGAWNPATTLGDKGIIFADGTVETGAFIIAPWSATSSGIRIDVTSVKIKNALELDSTLLDINNQAGTAGQILSSTGTGVDWINPSTIAVGNADTLDSLDSTQFLRSDVADEFTGTSLTINAGSSTNYFEVRHNTDTDIYMRLYCESGTANIADTFTDTTTDKKYIYFSNPNGSNDPGFIMHETSNATSPIETNEGVLHLVPSDDNAYGDYVSIHGTNDPDCIKLHTDGTIETATGYTLKFSSGTGNITANSPLEFNSTLIDINNVAGTSGQILSSIGTGVSWTNASFISVGNADLLDNIDSPRFVYGDNATKTTNISNFNAFLGSGFYDSFQGTGLPSATWYHLITSRHTNTGSNYQMQITGEFFNSSNLYYRIINNNTPSSWYRIWHEGNDGPGTGLNADLLDGQQGSYYLDTSATAQTKAGDFAASAYKGNPYDAVPTYSNGDYETIYWDTTESAIRLYSASDSSIGMAFPAFRVNVNPGDAFRIAVQIRASAVTTNGVYIRVYEYDGALPVGKTHVSNSATNPVVQEDTRGGSISPSYDNQAGNTSWQTVEFTYTPNINATWASVVILNWTGLGTNSLYIRDYKRELLLSGSSVGDATTLDGLDSTQFLRSDVADTHSGGVLTFSTGINITNGPGTIGGATFDNGWLRIGNSTLGWTFDNNEFYVAGAGIIGTLSGATLTFTARPAFNGGTSGSTSPFTVDSNTVVTNLNADLLDGQQGSYYLNTSATAQTKAGALTIGGSLELNGTLLDINNQAGTAGQVLSSTGTGVDWVDATAATFSVTASASNTTYYPVFVSGTGAQTPLIRTASVPFTYNASTGQLKTPGNVVAGAGSGSIALTVNDGYGNANLAFNHENGTPDVTGSSARIESSVDSATASFSFELGNSTTSGVAVGLSQIMYMSTGVIQAQVPLELNSTLLDSGNSAGTNGQVLISTGTGVDWVDTSTISFGNADTLDNLNSTQFLRSDADDSFSGTVTNSGTFVSYFNSNSPGTNLRFGRNAAQYYTFHGGSNGNWLTSISDALNPKPNLRFAYSVDGGATIANSYTLNGSSGTIWHSGNDGADSGLDADTLDGIQGASLLRSDANDAATGSYQFFRNNPAIGNGSYAQGNNHIELRTNNLSNPILGFHRQGSSAVALYHAGYANNLLRVRGADGTDGEVFWGGINYWLSSREGQPRLYFSNGGRSYYRSGNGHEWRNSGDSNIMVLSNTGQLTIPQVIRPRGYICKQGVNGGTYGNTFNNWWTGSTAIYYIDVTSWGWQSVPSDYRIKRNVRNLSETDVLQRIMSLRPVEYNPAKYAIFEESDEEKIGFIAHEVQELFPKAVENEKDVGDNQIQSIKQDAMIMYIVKAIQEQQKMIQSLRDEIELLKMQ